MMDKYDIVNLQTGERVADRYRFNLQSMIEGHKDTACPRWEQFLREVTCNDQMLQLYLQRMVGYCMTTETSEHCIFCLCGDGANGKSVFLNTIYRFMGPYACRAEDDLVGKQHKNKCIVNSSEARLVDKRLAIISEIIRGGFDAEQIIRLTKGNPLTARYLYGEAFEYIPYFKIMIATNFIPEIKSANQAIWKHIQIVPFNGHFYGEQMDTMLDKKLMDELPGIFNWAVEGAVEWYKYGLPNLEKEK